MTWPPQQGHAELDYYIWAAGRNLLTLKDGEWYTGPWGRIRAYLPAGRVEFIRLAPPKRIGTQGLRPLRKDEVLILRDAIVQEDLAKALVHGSLSQELTARVRNYYLLWLNTNAVAGLIRPLHQNFFRWLESHP